MKTSVKPAEPDSDGREAVSHFTQTRVRLRSAAACLSAAD